MPFVIHPRASRALARLATITTVGVLASTGVAAAACPKQATKTPFAQWGDTNSYYLAPGGSFEGSASQVGWKSALLTASNEPFYVHGATDQQSVTIKGGGTLASPTFCLDNSMPTFRFFARQTAPGSDLKVSLVVVKTGPGSAANVFTDLGDGSMPSWAPTGQLTLASGLAIPPGSSVTAQLVFQAPITSGSWQIDDVYIDPYAR